MFWSRSEAMYWIHIVEGLWKAYKIQCNLCIQNITSVSKTRRNVAALMLVWMNTNVLIIKHADQSLNLVVGKLCTSAAVLTWHPAVKRSSFSYKQKCYNFFRGTPHILHKKSVYTTGEAYVWFGRQGRLSAVNLRPFVGVDFKLWPTVADTLS
jgi:hypothetical protein